MTADAQAAATTVQWTEFGSVAAGEAWHRSGTWAALIERIRSAGSYPTKAACPWLKLATFGNARSSKGSLRHDGNVLQISGIEGDYDGEVMQPEEALRRLEAAHVRCAIYTSPSHTALKPRWRVLAPCSGPLPAGARAALLARINGVLGGVLSGESFTLSQAYYFGQVAGVDYRVLVAFDDPDEGHFIDDLDALDDLAAGKGKPAISGVGTDGARPGEAMFSDAVAARGRPLRTGDGRRELLKAYIASRSARGLRGDDIKVLVDGIASRYFDPADPPSERDIDGLVQWAKTKDGARQAEAQEHSDAPPAFSDDQLAVEFVATYGAGYRWSPGLGWMSDTGVVWRRDDTLSRFDLARRICRAAAARVPKSESEQRRLASAKTVNAVLALAQSDQRLVVPATVWDGSSMMLNTPAGMVDLRSAQIRPRRADDYVTQTTRVAPDFTRGAELFDVFLLDVFGGDHDLVDFMQRALFFCLTGDRREQVLFFWHGSGANGKSTLLDLVTWVLDSYALKLPAAALMVTRNYRHPTELAQLRGRRLAIASELEEGQFWNEALIKELTGDEVLTARYMRGDFFEFPMTQKHVIVGNHKPRLRGGDPAIARRLVLVPFEQRFEGARRDKDMPAKLKAEAPAILAWLIRGAVRWFRDGLQIPRRVLEASADYMHDHDDLVLWIDECCVRAGESKASELYASFSRWKKARGEHAPAMTTWGQRLQALPGIARRRSNGIRYDGIHLTEAEANRVRHSL